jgi:hypothetical protein
MCAGFIRLAEILSDVIKYAAGHFHLLPSAESRRKRQRPEYEKTYGAYRGFIDPSARANLDVHRIFHLPEHDVERRRHADNLPPTAHFLNLQKLAAVLRFQSLTFEFLFDEPILDRSEQFLIMRRRAWKTAALMHYFLQYCAQCSSVKIAHDAVLMDFHIFKRWRLETSWCMPPAVAPPTGAPCGYKRLAMLANPQPIWLPRSGPHQSKYFWPAAITPHVW